MTLRSLLCAALLLGNAQAFAEATHYPLTVQSCNREVTFKQAPKHAVSHDINMRPALGFEREVERIRVERINDISHVIKASDEDIHWLYDMVDGADVDGVVKHWIGDSGRHVFITRGGDGVSIYRPAADGSGVKRFDVASRSINVVDTVGAGDTFCANLLGQLSDADILGTDPFDRLASLSDEDLAEFVRIAGVAASITCERAGAEPPTLADLNAVLSSL